MVGLEVGAELPQGVPAVRLHIVHKQVELMAAGFVKLDDRLPARAEEAFAERDNFWTLPKSFQSSKAAIAVTSPLAILRQTSEAGGKDDNNVRRVSAIIDRQHPPIVASMPDFLASWIATRFIQGRRPTTRSIQVSMSAALNCFLTGPITKQSQNPAIVVFCFKNHSSITAFYEGRLVLYREHPVGYLSIREAISTGMRIAPGMVDALMNDPAVDVSSAITPLLTSLFRQVDISSDYLARRKSCEIRNFYIYGIPDGVKYWSNLFKQVVGTTLNHLHPFGGIVCSNKRLVLPESFEKEAPLFMNAIGAARALLEELEDL